MMDLAEIAGPLAIVVHGGYDKWRFDGNMDMWFNNSLRYGCLLSGGQKDRTRSMENVFDDTLNL
jgi:hypothetical protein